VAYDELTKSLRIITNARDKPLELVVCTIGLQETKYISEHSWKCCSVSATWRVKYSVIK